MLLSGLPFAHAFVRMQTLTHIKPNTFMSVRLHLILLSTFSARRFELLGCCEQSVYLMWPCDCAGLHLSLQLKHSLCWVIYEDRADSCRALRTAAVLALLALPVT